MAEYSDNVINLCDSYILVEPPHYMRDVCIVLDSDDSVSYDAENSLVGRLHQNSSTPSTATSAYSAHSSISSSNKRIKNNSKKKSVVKNPNKRTSKSMTMKQMDISKDNNNIFGDCPICYDPLGQNPLASTKCGHVYCKKCIEQYLLVDQRCPTCRQKLKGKSSYHPLYLNN